ncbi:DUF370 domain-containing protein (plasmid) [Paenibacillus rhizovicinus]|uniref:DUF370 domain-containing protein n=1 Tax=Paenibacillus rhizovicinus TaxID=2704463 RepID=A0A6C0PCL8_9BACL|nr:extracellular matrix/biofilm biosynthesis regulator RemA family protein [Paenibacillus rhizovicinus]QHW35833.1 DUF370 domain-containing protein [Paenibacillus rhizovicinus]
MFVDVGFNNFVEVEKIITISRPDSSPIKRLMKEAKDSGRFIDLTQGKKTRSVIVTSSLNQTLLVGAAVQATTIVTRIKKMRDEHTARIIAAPLMVPGLEVIGGGSSEE